MSNIVQDADTLIDEIIPSAELDKLKVGRTEEILQPLLDLGYIKQAIPAELPDGIRLFRKEYFELNLIPEFKPNFLFLPEHELEGEELNLLHTLTALDGDFTIEKTPVEGTTNLISRIIHYRLSIHHLFKLPINTPYDLQHFSQIENFRSWIKNLPKDSIDLFNLLGNIPALIQHIAKDSNGGLNKKILAFKYHKSTEPNRFKVKVSDHAKEEVGEDVEEKDMDTESSMAQQETEIDDLLDECYKEEIFDQKEQDALEKQDRKKRKKRSRLIQIAGMSKIVHQEMDKISGAFNEQSDAITLQIKDLKKLNTTLTKEKKILDNSIKQKKAFIDTLEKSQKKLAKKERILKRKKRKGKHPEEIKKLEDEIKKIKKAPKQIESLEIEISTFSQKLFPINEQFKVVSKQLNTFNKSLENLIQNREKIIGEKQSDLKLLLDKLDTLEKKVDKLKFSFKGKLRKVLDKTFYENTVKEEIFRRRNRATLKTFSEDAYNNYLIRLIQIFQWTNGFYYGKLDNEIGNRAFSALDDMATYSRGLRLKFILSRLSDNHAGTEGYWILNVKYLFIKLSAILQDEKQKTTQDLLEEYEDKFVKKDSKIGNKVTDAAYSEIVEENQQDIKNPGSLRRIYYGIKRIATTLFDALIDLIKIIKQGIEHLIYMVKNLIKIVYREIREGVRKFRDGLKFLFGNRVLNTVSSNGSLIITKYDFDFDAISYIPPDIKKQDAKAHSNMVNRFGNNLNFTLELTGKLLKWVFQLIELGTPIGWARLAIKIAIHYKHLIIKWLVGLGKKLTQIFISIKYDIKALKNNLETT